MGSAVRAPVVLESRFLGLHLPSISRLYERLVLLALTSRDLTSSRELSG